MNALYLSEADVRSLVDMPAVIGIVEVALRNLADGKVQNVPRMRAAAPGCILHTMSAAAEYLGTCGWKAYTTTKQGAKFLVGLYHTATGRTTALIEADLLGQLRTGAVTGVAVKYLAAAGADRLGLFGTGTQARTQLAAVAASRRLAKVSVYGRDAERRKRFAAETAAELHVDVEPVDSARRAVHDMPMVVTATTSREPVFDGNDLSAGALVCAVGSNWLNKAEIDATTVRRAARVVCDDIAACKHEAGELAAAQAVGAFTWEQAVTLGDVVAGRAVGRAKPEEIVVFKSVGLALEDVALATEILARARKAGIGMPLPF